MNLKLSNSLACIASIILLLHIQPSFSYIFTGKFLPFLTILTSSLGYEVIELNTTVPAAFIQDTTYWTASSLVSSSILYYPCGSYYLLGGYNVLGIGRDNYFQRIYSGLNSHTMVRFSLTAFFLDSWDTPWDGFLLSFDAQLLDGWHIPYGNYPGYVCGAGL